MQILFNKMWQQNVNDVFSEDNTLCKVAEGNDSPW